MKFRSLITISLILLLSVSCDVLNQKPQQSLPTNEVFTSESNVRAVLAGAYSGMQLAFADDVVFVELAGDNATHTGSYPTWGNIDNHNLLPSNTEARDMYINHYDVINRANNLIEYTAGVEDVSFSDEEKANIVAQAKVIRALSYHSLVRWFGGVPLVTKPLETLDESSNVARATVEAVYTQIIKDLTEAEQTLGENGSSGASTITGYATKAILARVYLYNAQYDLAEAKATEVIGSGNFAVTDVDYISNFGQAETDPQNSQESILELLFTTEDSNNLSFWARPNGNGGRYEYGPAQEYIALYDSLDTRQNANLREYSGALRLGKYFRTDGSDNLIIVRLAEMYLIRAEAIARQDYASAARQQAAQDDINVIRNRAGLTDVDPTTVATLDTFIDEVLVQRRLELDQEGHRWHDLVRTGEAISVLNIDANDQLWPIPQREVDANSAISPEDQNPGY